MLPAAQPQAGETAGGSDHAGVGGLGEGTSGATTIGGAGAGRGGSDGGVIGAGAGVMAGGGGGGGSILALEPDPAERLPYSPVEWDRLFFSASPLKTRVP